MITYIRIFHALLFYNTLNVIVTNIDPRALEKQEHINKEFNWSDFNSNNTALYTHRDCPLIQQRSICCPEIITLTEPALTNVCNNPIAHTCSIPVKKSIQELCPECIYKINIPTKYLPKIKEYMSDPRCNYKLPQHEYRKKNKAQRRK